MSEQQVCEYCDGCGQVANTPDAEPWTAWTELPASSAVAISLGWVKPVPCDVCGGTGRLPSSPSQENAPEEVEEPDQPAPDARRRSNMPDPEYDLDGFIQAARDTLMKGAQEAIKPDPPALDSDQRREKKREEARRPQPEGDVPAEDRERIGALRASINTPEGLDAVAAAAVEEGRGVELAATEFPKTDTHQPPVDALKGALGERKYAESQRMIHLRVLATALAHPESMRGTARKQHVPSGNTPLDVVHEHIGKSDQAYVGRSLAMLVGMRASHERQRFIFDNLTLADLESYDSLCRTIAVGTPVPDEEFVRLLHGWLQMPSTDLERAAQLVSYLVLVYSEHDQSEDELLFV
jgi:hypothetical protein